VAITVTLEEIEEILARRVNDVKEGDLYRCDFGWSNST
jgi:hypothetical protein